MTSNPYLVTIGDLDAGQVTDKPVQITASPEWGVDASSVLPDPPLSFSGELTLTSGGLLVRGLLSGTVRHTCVRCLNEWIATVVADVAQLVTSEGDDDSEDDGEYHYSRDSVDLEPILRDELLLALPLLPVCPEGCEQLVEVPQNDLNTATPNDTGESGSPFAVLKDLLDHEQ